MEPERRSRCPNCAELWKRIDQLTEEKARGQRTQGVQIALSVVLLVLLLVSLALRLLS